MGRMERIGGGEGKIKNQRRVEGTKRIIRNQAQGVIRKKRNQKGETKRKRMERKVERKVERMVERRKEKMLKRKRIEIITVWQYQLTTNFGVLIFHWSKF